ncbi:UDP-N-acetylglucosamine 2-epimerase [Micromonospora sp. NPDC050417]|uniref:UDP-N-acetylglucosamine 2-epimerase n=1 Tax=Micromonospora sp. NPDC050417 TaxID=3364280 RepID=UPI00378F7321
MRGSGSTSAEVMVLIGTRPEGVKTAPLVRQLRLDTRFTATVVDTGQHPGRVGEALAPFGLTAEVTLEPVRHTGSLAELAAALVTATDAVLAEHRPAAVVVQGGTLTALVGGVVAFWHHLPVVHLEAGLRTHDLDRPFPEEGGRGPGGGGGPPPPGPPPPPRGPPGPGGPGPPPSTWHPPRPRTGTCSTRGCRRTGSWSPETPWSTRCTT